MQNMKGSNAPRVFFALCGEDRSEAYALLEELGGAGLWPTIITSAKEEHLAGCALFFALVSPAALRSHEWRQAFLTAVRLGLKTICIVHPDAQLTPVMRRLLSGLPAVALDESCAKTLLCDEAVRECIGNAPVFRLVAPDGTAYPIAPEGLIIGRDPSCGLCLSDKSVSRFHAQIRINGGVPCLTDTGSMNGTCLNEIPLDPHDECEMEPGDEICFGSCHFILEQTTAH